VIKSLYLKDILCILYIDISAFPKKKILVEPRTEKITTAANREVENRVLAKNKRKHKVKL
jgi:hypothetical protein